MRRMRTRVVSNDNPMNVMFMEMLSLEREDDGRGAKWWKTRVMWRVMVDLICCQQWSAPAE